MYDLMQHHQYHHYSIINGHRCIATINFFILKFVVGEQRIKDAIQRTINKKKAIHNEVEYMCYELLFISFITQVFNATP